MRMSLPFGGQKRLRLVAGLFFILTLVVANLLPLGAGASSHREAPNISQDPAADGTDLYAFVSPDKQDTVTLVANYVPLQNPAAGPNFFRFGDDVTYQIHVDNVGDAKDHIVFTFTFKTTTVNPNTFLYNVGPIAFDGLSGTYTNWNRPQTYTVKMTKNGKTTTLGSNLLTPPNNVGPTSTPGYSALAQAATYSLNDNIKVFAGQRADPFYADLGKIFDLLQFVLVGGENYLADLNVNSIIIQVPIDTLKGPKDNEIIGVWTTSSRNKTTVIHTDGTRTGSGGLVQVSRLGMPLVNEVVIPLGKKDRFNATALTSTSDGQFLSYVTTPEVANLFHILSIDTNAPLTNRLDLVALFLTGIPGLNQPKNVVPSEQLRLNMDIPVSHIDPNTVNRMGVLGGEADGFPNGRRLADDIVDIALQSVDGILCQTGGPLAGGTPCRTVLVNPALGDGVNAAQFAFQTSFPYLADPSPP